ncbi:orcokinin isoform c [Lasius niger]|uniref:Orcokinin isoform c n=1 Tax=Lasius niger TaxID=67767 RepID=A0A0J7NN08_LASNI|nr:orcokinin isoform c [Lasius niger]
MTDCIFNQKGTNQRVKRNDDPDDYGYFLSEEQVRLLLDAGRAYLSQHPDSVSDEQERDAVGRRKVSGRIHNSPISSRVFADSTNHQHRLDQNDDQDNHHLSDQVTAHGRLVKNLDQFDDEYYVRNLDHIGGGHLVRNLDQIGGGHLVRDLDQIDDGHHVRNLDQIGGGHLVRNLDQIGGGHLLRNLDQIGGGHLVRNLNQIDAENLARRAAYASNAAAKRRSLSASADQPVAVSRILASGARGLNRINLSTNLDRLDRR